MKITINAAMVLQKALRGRLAELSQLRSASATTDTYYEPKKVVEPRYSLLALDKRCVEIENALLDMDTAIKTSNAITSIEIAADKNALLSPLT